MKEDLSFTFLNDFYRVWWKIKTNNKTFETKDFGKVLDTLGLLNNYTWLKVIWDTLNVFRSKRWTMWVNTTSCFPV